MLRYIKISQWSYFGVPIAYVYWRSINIYFTKCKYIIEPQEDKVLNYYFTYTKLLPPRTNNNNHHKNVCIFTILMHFSTFLHPSQSYDS